MIPRIPIGSNKQENLAQLVERYKRLSEPKNINAGLMYFTLDQDLKLYNRLMMTKKHPVDTGLLKQKWVMPANRVVAGATKLQLTQNSLKYMGSFMSGKYNVYVLNEATIGEQQKLKYAKEGWGHFKKKKVRGSYKLKRYLKFVSKHNDFYTQELRTIRQGLDSDWKKFVPNYLYERLGIMV